LWRVAIGQRKYRKKSPTARPRVSTGPEILSVLKKTPAKAGVYEIRRSVKSGSRNDYLFP